MPQRSRRLRRRTQNPRQDVNGVEVSSAGKELCLACHDSSADWFGPDYPSTSAPTRDATGYPVAGTWPGTATYESTPSAHGLIPESTEDGRRQRADPPRAGLVPLLPRGARRSQRLRRPADHLHRAFAGDACLRHCRRVLRRAVLRLPRRHEAERIRHIARRHQAVRDRIGGIGGHSIVTSGGTLPVGAPLPCFECHNPHGSAARQLLAPHRRARCVSRHDERRRRPRSSASPATPRATRPPAGTARRRHSPLSPRLTRWSDCRATAACWT